MDVISELNEPVIIGKIAKDKSPKEAICNAVRSSASLSIFSVDIFKENERRRRRKTVGQKKIKEIKMVNEICKLRHLLVIPKKKVPFGFIPSFFNKHSVSNACDSLRDFVHTIFI